jgi:hypothetical protein
MDTVGFSPPVLVIDPFSVADEAVGLVAPPELVTARVDDVVKLEVLLAQLVPAELVA